MKHLFSTFTGLALAAQCVLPAFSQSPSVPTVREGEFHCFRGMPDSMMNYSGESGATAARKTMRGPKLGNSKYDNFDGHDLREVPTEGDYKVLVVLVQFKDVKFTQGKGDPQSLIDEMLNGEDFTYQNAAGSANAFYRTTSFGKFNPIFNVIGPVTLDKKEEEYVVSNPEDTYVNPETGKPVEVYQPGRMVEEVLAAIDDRIDFREYDSNNDGDVDFIYLFHAGKGATTGGDSKKTIWPHAFTLTSAIGHPVEHDGVRINRYATSSELASDNKLTGIGTFCHEFGHVLGLPDLYDTANNNGRPSKCFSPGAFDCMDAGNYNNNHKSPATFSSYERYALEWMKPATLTGSGHFTMLPLEAHPFSYKVNSSANDLEYFLLENRGNTLYDQYLPGHGLLVWHIDYNPETWESGKVNNNKDHQCVDLIEADNEKSETGRDGDPFPGAYGICEFTSTITPAFKDWTNKSVGYELYEIRRNFDNTVEFLLTSASGKEMEGAAMAAPAPVAVAAGKTSVELEWPAVEGATQYFVSVFPSAVFSGKTLEYSDYVPGYCFRRVAEVEPDSDVCFTVLTDLLPNTNYSVMIYAAGEVNASRMAAPLTVSTVDGEDFANASTNLYLSAAGDDVVASWDGVANAEEYEVSIVTRSKGEETGSPLDCDFSGNLLPENWKGSGKFDTRQNYFGVSAPSYRLQDPGSVLESPIYEDCLRQLSFWAIRRKSYEDGLCALNVLTADAKGAWSLWTRIDDIPNPGREFTLDFPAGVYGVRLVYDFWSTGLDINIDDLKMTFCKGSVDTPVKVEVDMTGENSASIRGLQPAVDYVAYVTPKMGATSGARSNEVAFRLETLPDSGVEDVIGDSAASLFRIEGNEVIPADPELEYDVYSIDGLVMARSHKGAITLPARGIYLLRASGKTMRIRI